MTRYCRCVGNTHTCGIQTIIVQNQAPTSPNPEVVYIGQGGPRGAQGVQGPQGPAGVGAQGTQGIQGAAGPGSGAQGTQGLQGPAGGGVTSQQLADAIAGAALGSTDDLPEGVLNKYFTTSRVAYTHNQGVASSTWTVIHNLGFYPNVTVQDSAGTIYEGEVTYTTSDSLTLTFSSSFSGKAYLS